MARYVSSSIKLIQHIRDNSKIMKSQPIDLSPFSSPLTVALGSKGHISVLRTLFLTERPMMHSELIDRTSLSRQGVYDVIRKLAEAGVVTYKGSGNQVFVELRQQYPFLDLLKDIFQSEHQRLNQFLAAIRALIPRMTHEPDSVWVYAVGAVRKDFYGDPVKLAILGKTNRIKSLVGEFHTLLFEYDIGRKFDVALDIVGVTASELPGMPELFPDNMLLVCGRDPLEILNSRDTHV
jgi:predicted DNA-binding protein YlxM (UPF0122 family)